MFSKARLQLTLWYTVLIFTLSLIFSLVIYQISAVNLHNMEGRWRLRPPSHAITTFNPELPNAGQTFIGHSPDYAQELDLVLKDLAFNLFLLNLIILLFTFFLGYFLAGRTLLPIKKMLQKQQDFTAAAAHELRTPLAILRAQTESQLLLKNLSAPKIASSLRSNLEEITRMENLTTALLQIARLENTQKLAQEKISLSDLIGQVQKNFTPFLKQKKQILQVNLPASEIEFSAHPQLLGEVLIILLENASKFSPAKSTLTLSAAPSDKKPLLIITVSNPGPGITATDLPHVFEKFYQADQSRSQNPGFGLGLAIAQQIIKLHSGKIGVKSNPGEQTTFSLILPRP